MKVNACHPTRRLGIGELIATLMLIALAVVAALVLYAFVSGLIANVNVGGPSTLVTAVGQLTVPGSSNSNGVLSITLRNDGTVPISSVVVACPTTYFMAATCGASTVSMSYSGNLVSGTNLVPPGMTTVGSAIVQSASNQPFAAGTTYTLIVTVLFTGGSTQIIAMNVPSFS